jgi:transcription antitermination factor NusG
MEIRADVVEVAKLYLLDTPSTERDTEAVQPLVPDQPLLSPTWLEARWCAAYVVARHEKVVAAQLACRSMESFLPLYRAVHHWKHRRANVELPLFPGYLFIRIGPAERVRALEVPGLVHIVSSRGMPVAVPDEQIENLRTALRLRKSEPFPYITAGKRIRIKTGPLQGLEGVVVRHNNQCRIIVSVDFIQRSTSVELWPDDLECMHDTVRTTRSSHVALETQL